VLEAIATGEIDWRSYENYLKMENEGQGFRKNDESV